MEGSQIEAQPNSPDDEIDVRLKIINTSYIRFKRSESVQNVKALIQETEGLSQDVQELVFAGNKLKDDQQLDHYGIDNNSTLHLFVKDVHRMKIFVALPRGEIVVIKASSDDTVRKIKKLIEVWDNIQSDTFTLVYNGTLLADHWTLASANVKKNSFVNLVFCPRDVLSFSVRVPNGKILKVEVKLLFTVRDVKGMVAAMIDIPIKNQDLFYEGKRLEDCKTMAYYDVKENAMLEFPLSYRIFIGNCDGSRISHYVNKFTTVKDVIESFRDTSRFSNQHLFHGPYQLEVCRTLASYEINEDAILEMVPSYQIFVRTFYKATLTLDVHKYETAKDVKRKLFDKLNVAMDHQVIRFKGKILQDEVYLGNSGIEKNCDLDLQFRGQLRS